MASKPALSKRPSVAPSSEPKPPLKVHSLAVIGEKAQITGTHPVEIGEHSIIHPHARIRSTGGSVTIGKSATVSDTAVVGSDEGDVVIGDGVNVETGAVVQAKSVGDYTTIDVRAIVGKGAVIGKVGGMRKSCVDKIDAQ